MAGPQQRKSITPGSQKPGLFAGQDPNRQCVGPKYANFFALNYPPALQTANAYGIDVNLPLGLSAMESGWARSRMAREQNNMVGATPGGGGTSGVKYKSIESGWRHWGDEWGPHVRGVKDDVPTFVKNLLQDNSKIKGAVDRRAGYNTLIPPGGDPDWPVVVPR